MLQKDAAWKDPNGGPADPQSLGSGPRDVLRTANFTGNTAQGFVVASGSATIANERFQINNSGCR